MDINEKANYLKSHLGYPNWLTAIGIGENEDGITCFYVYVNRIKDIKVPNVYMDVPIKVKLMKNVKPA